jgi:Icc-related predicted phosphoesterase
MKILHSSDLHGDYHKLLKDFGDADFDVWIDTGDFFPNRNLPPRADEPRYQTRWFKNKQLGRRLTKWLAGRPLISVPGNHDYVSLANLMREGKARAYEATPGGVVVNRIRYAGFRQIPYIHGEWVGETQPGDFREVVEEVFADPPDILLTHAGPAFPRRSGMPEMTGSDDYHGGISSLSTALSFRPHGIKAHFFGHDHQHGSKTREEMGILFSNSATKPKIVTVPGLAVNNPSKKRKPRVPKRRSVVHEVHILKTPKAGAHTPKKGKKGYQRREKHPKKIAYNPVPRPPLTVLVSFDRAGAVPSGTSRHETEEFVFKRQRGVPGQRGQGTIDLMKEVLTFALRAQKTYQHKGFTNVEVLILDYHGHPLPDSFYMIQGVPKDHSLRRNGSVALKNSSASEVYDPRNEQRNAHVQGIYEGMVLKMLGLHKDPRFRDSEGKVIFRDSKGMRLDAKHGVVGPSTWGIQGNVTDVSLSKKRHRDVDHLILNRQDYEETLGLQRQKGFYRYTKEPTKDGFRYFVWPMPPGVELPMVGDNASKAERTAEMLSQQHDPRRTGRWWKPPRKIYTRSEVDYWLPPASVFKS